MTSKKPKPTKSSQNIEKLKQSNKLKKNILNANTLEAITPREKMIPLKIPISKICSKSIFVSKIGSVLYLQDLKKFIGP